MKTTTLIACASAVFAISLAGCADMKITPAGPVPDTRIQNPDATLATLVREELAARSSLNAKHLKVAVSRGEVTLSGDVDDGQHLVRIAKFVQSLPGVTAVIPDLNPKQ
jgi:osmotically-inducible protein OsmY